MFAFVGSIAMRPTKRGGMAPVISVIVVARGGSSNKNLAEIRSRSTLMSSFCGEMPIALMRSLLAVGIDLATGVIVVPWLIER